MPTAFLQRGKTPLLNKCPRYDTKQSDGEASILELWGMWSTPSLPLLQGSPGTVAHDRDLSVGQVELFDI